MPQPDDKRFNWLYVRDDDARRKEWQRIFKMKPVKLPGCPMHWAADQRCNAYTCTFTSIQRYEFMDHVTCYRDEDGERVLIYQPYHVDAGNLEKMCERLGLGYDISGRGWYGYGTVMIELRSKASIDRRMERRRLERVMARASREAM